MQNFEDNEDAVGEIKAERNLEVKTGDLPTQARHNLTKHIEKKGGKNNTEYVTWRKGREVDAERKIERCGGEELERYGRIEQQYETMKRPLLNRSGCRGKNKGGLQSSPCLCLCRVALHLRMAEQLELMLFRLRF